MEIFRNGVRIYYTDAGHGEVTLILIHGLFLDGSCWQSQTKKIASVYRIIVPDLPGHGQSGTNRKQWTIEEFTKDISELIYQLDLQKVILVGHSIGASIALELAANHPRRIIGMVAIEAFRSVAEIPEELIIQIDKMLKILREHYTETCEIYARQGLLTATTPKEIKAKIIDAYKNSYQPTGLGALNSVFHFAEQEQKLLKKTKFKLHIINVNYAPTNEHLLKKYCDNGYSLMIIPGTCHFPMMENPDDLNRAIEKDCHKIVVHARQRELAHH